MTDTTNIAETFFENLGHLGTPARLDLGEIDLTKPVIVTRPQHVAQSDLTDAVRAAAERFKPLARTGTATLESLDSFIDWTNRHKGEASVVFAHATDTERALTSVIDYQLPGAPASGEAADPLARHGKHRGVYAFPISKEWTAWQKACGDTMSGPDLGEFLENRAEDILNPTPWMLTGAGKPGEAWEETMTSIAQKLGGRFGSFSTLKNLADEFKMQESTGIVAKTNRDTGETTIQFVNEHKTPEGNPIQVPTLFMILIPVFKGGPVYPIVVRIRYRRQGAGVVWLLSLYNPDAAMEDAWNGALEEVKEKTGLLLLEGCPER